MSGQLAGRVIAISGGNGGIGLGIARAAAEAGAEVMIWGRNPKKTAAATEELRSQGLAVDSLACDVTDEEHVRLAVADTVDRFGHLDGFVANAAAPGEEALMTDLGLDAWREVIDTNLTGVFTCFAAAAGQMLRQGTPGSLVAVSSIITHFGAARKSHYAAAKAAVDSLVRTSAVELARHGIRVNGLAPGWTATEMVEEGFGGEERERFESTILRRTPLRRWGTPDDYDKAIVYLLDPTVSFHTGDIVTVDGGYTLT